MSIDESTIRRIIREGDIGSIMDSLYDLSLDELIEALESVKDEGTFGG